MKDVREFLSLLTERSIGLTYPDRSGSAYNTDVSAINQIDVAHAMGLVKNPKAACLLGVKYGGRSSDIHKLDLIVWTSVLDLFPDWTMDKTYQKGREFIRRMCQLAVAEHMDEHRCPSCNGTSPAKKEAMKNVFHDTVFCETCGDTGRVYPSEADRAETMGIDLKLWERHWSDRFRQIQAMLHAWEIDGAMDLYAALKDAA